MSATRPIANGNRWVPFRAHGAYRFSGPEDRMPSASNQRQCFPNPKDYPPDLPFSDAVVAGDTLYVSGHVGIDMKTRQIPAQLEDEVRLLMDGIKASVTQAGMTMNDVVNVTIYCPDLSLFERFNAVYKTYFTAGKYPARAFLGSGPLIFGAHFEITAIAVRQRSAAAK
jgi:2-iminobutanoate/2-iminopropanoate deaminase